MNIMSSEEEEIIIIPLVQENKKKRRGKQIQINIQLNSLLIEIERKKLENTIYYSITYYLYIHTLLFGWAF